MRAFVPSVANLVFYPVSTLPPWMQYISKALPPSSVFEGMRRVVLHEGVSTRALALGGGLAFVYVVLAENLG